MGNRSSFCPVPLVSRCKSDYDKEMAYLTTVKPIKFLLYELERCSGSLHNWKLVRLKNQSWLSIRKIQTTKNMCWTPQQINF